MQLNVLLLPLLGGFLFLSIFYRSAYFIASQSAATLSFWLAAAGLALLAIARLAIMACALAAHGPHAVAIPLLGTLLVPLLGLLAFGLLFFALLELIRWRRGVGAKLWDWRPPIAAALFVGTIAAIGLLVQEVPIIFPRAFGISIGAVWIVLWGCLTYCVVSWGERIRVTPGSILFRAAIVGLFYVLLLGVVAFYPQDTRRIWLRFAEPTVGEIGSEQLGTSLLAALLGPLFGVTLNLIYPLSAVQSRLFSNRATSSLERLFYRATKRGKMVMLTLDDGKVYCGYVDWIPGNPGATDAFLEILPVFSGFRESESKRVRLPVSYASFYKQLPAAEWVQFKKILPLARISAAGEFDPEHFETFAKSAAAASADSAKPVQPVVQVTVESPRRAKMPAVPDHVDPQSRHYDSG